MTPKHYKPSDPIIQWAYFMEDVKPLQTSTCALFWRSVVLTPLKVLGPVSLAGFIVFIITMVIMGYISPESVPVAFRPRPSQRTTTMMEELWPALVLFGMVAISVLGHVTGLWGYLHRFCLPVEIEGGLVRQGLCPVRGCVGALVDEGGIWRCRKCAGYFVPPAMQNPNPLEGQR